MKRLLTKEHIYWLTMILLAILLHCDHYINADEGVILNGAWNIINGRAPYLDYFSFIPPLSSYLVAAAFLMTGAAFWAAKAVAIAFLLLGALALFRLTSRLFGRRLAYLAPVFFLLATSWQWIINHNFFNIIAILWSLDYLLAYRQEGRRIYLFMSAVIGGISVLFLQQKGLVFLGAASLWLLFASAKRKEGIKNAIQFSLVSVVPLVILCAFFPPTLLYEQLIIFPFFNYVEANRLPLALFGLTAAALAVFIWDRRKANYEERLLHLVAVFLLLSSLPLPDAYHLSLVLLPLLPIIVISLVNKKTTISWLYLSVFALLMLYPASRYLAARLEPENKVRPGFIAFIEEKCPGRYLHSGPFFPNAYYESRKLSASSYDILITGHQTDEQFKEAEEEVRQNMPSCAVRAKVAARFRHSPDNPVDRFLDEEYEPAFEDAWASVWIRK